MTGPLTTELVRDYAVVRLVTKFGPILKAAFPNEHSITRFDVAHSLANAALAATNAGQPEAELAAALEPFATSARVHKNEPGSGKILVPCTVADLRRAQSILAALKAHDDQEGRG